MFSIEPAPPLYLAVEGYCGTKSWYERRLLEVLDCGQIGGYRNDREHAISYRLSAWIRQVEDSDVGIGLGINRCPCA